MNAARRRSVEYFFELLCILFEESIRIGRNFLKTSFSVQCLPLRFWSHSKYDTVTPPEFASTSGTIGIPFLNNISSASGVIGPFASSSITFAFILFAFLSVI